ncbi:MAG: glycosyltransferase family 4 protein [Chthoniobacterales bacterium]|nr:glycosyltransferase family 4 protein [Chthoniobacterales bacterium]
MDQPQEPTRCFIASGCAIATTHLYRCIHLQQQLAALGYEAHVAEWFEEGAVHSKEALGYDLIFLYRLPLWARIRKVIDDTRARGKPLIFDTDDLIFEPNRIHEHRAVESLTAEEQAMHAEGVRGYLATLEACDTTVTATPLLAEFARARARPAYVHRNALGSEMLAYADKLYQSRQLRPASSKVVIGYGSGSPTHDVDFQEAAGALLHVLERFRKAELWIAGPLALPLEFERFGERVRRFPLTDWRGWFELASRMDIALAPLEMNNVFCRAKSEIKFVESAAAGVPVVASDIDPFRDSMTHGQNGLLAANEKEWTEALTLLVENADRRSVLAEAARRTVLQHYTPHARGAQLAALLPQLAPSFSRRVTPAVALGSTADMPRRILIQKGVAFVRRARAMFNTAAQPEAPSRAASLRIHWIIPEPIPGAGGDVSIFRIIRDLAAFGHDCQVQVVPYRLMVNFTTEEIRTHVREHFGVTGAEYHRWAGHIDDADCSFATFWPTVEILSGLLKGGRRYYLVQDFEPSFYEGDSHHILRSENTYRAGLHCITLGEWLARLLRERYGATADHFDFAVDTSIYSPRPVERETRQRLCFYARPSTPRRGYELGLAALTMVKSRYPDVEIVFFGSCDLTPEPPFPVTNRGKISVDHLAELYSSCDVGVVFSLSNPSFVPLEMMACRCAVVEIASERWRGVLTHGQDAWLAEPTPEAVADAIVRLLGDKPTRDRIAGNAYQRTRSMDWRQSARQVEAVLLRYARK